MPLRKGQHVRKHRRTSVKHKKFTAGGDLVDPHKHKKSNWKESLQSVGDNPDWIFQNIRGLEKELKKDTPSPSYMREKVRNISMWINEIQKFHSGEW